MTFAETDGKTHNTNTHTARMRDHILALYLVLHFVSERFLHWLHKIAANPNWP